MYHIIPPEELDGHGIYFCCARNIFIFFSAISVCYWTEDRCSNVLTSSRHCRVHRTSQMEHTESDVLFYVVYHPPPPGLIFKAQLLRNKEGAAMINVCQYYRTTPFRSAVDETSFSNTPPFSAMALTLLAVEFSTFENCPGGVCSIHCMRYRICTIIWRCIYTTHNHFIFVGFF